MAELTQVQISVLQRLVGQGFTPVAFPLYANAVGIRKGECAALLEPVPGQGFRLFGEPSILLEGNLTVRITQAGGSWFVWKNLRREATPEKVVELRDFVAELTTLLEPRA